MGEIEQKTLSRLDVESIIKLDYLNNPDFSNFYSRDYGRSLNAGIVVILNNILVEDYIAFGDYRNVNIVPIILNNCTFKGTVHLAAKNYRLIDFHNTSIKELLFNDETNYEDVFLNNCDISLVEFSGKIQKFKFYLGKYPEVRFGKGNIKKLLFDGGVYDNIRFVNTDIERYLHFAKGDYKKIYFLEGNFKCRVEFSNIIVRDSLNFWAGVFKEKVIIKGDEIKQIEIRKNIFLPDEQYLEFYYNKVSENGYEDFSGNLHLKDQKLLFINELNIEINTKTNVSISACIINKIYFQNSTFYREAQCEIKNITVNKLSFVNFSNNGLIKLSGVKTNDNNVIFLKMDIQKYGLISRGTIYNKPSIGFDIFNSNLGKTEFIDCNFSSAYFSFKSSKIVEIFLAGTKFPVNLHAEYETDRIVAYSQLRKVYESMGDNITSLEINKNSLESYRRSISITYNPLKWKGEFVNLGLSKITSNYGLNWLKSFMVSMVMISILLALYCISIGFKYDPTDEGWNNVWVIFSNIFEFANPTHRPSFLIEVDEFKDYYLKNNSWSRFIDGLSKIVAAYLIFQTIQAFRKFGKT